MQPDPQALQIVPLGYYPSGHDSIQVLLFRYWPSGHSVQVVVEPEHLRQTESHF